MIRLENEMTNEQEYGFERIKEFTHLAKGSQRYGMLRLLMQCKYIYEFC